LNKSEKIYFSKNADVVVGEQMHKLRITPGKYQITT